MDYQTLLKEIKDCSPEKPEDLWRIARDCFIFSSVGRRPWRLHNEELFYEIMKEGYWLATVYVAKTGDCSHFPDWFSVLHHPHYIDGTIEQMNRSRFKEMEDEYRTIAGYLENTLDMQFSLLREWLAGDVEGFVRHWGAKRIEELLEYVDDKEFFSILRQLTQLKNNPDVAGILAYYAEDDEPQISEYALRLLTDYGSGMEPRE